MHFVMPCLADIPGRPALFKKKKKLFLKRETEEEWFWGRGEVEGGTEKKGSVFAKGSPPHGLWPGPRLVDKEPQRWQGQSTATEFLCGSRGARDLASTKPAWWP